MENREPSSLDVKIDSFEFQQGPRHRGDKNSKINYFYSGLKKVLRIPHRIFNYISNMEPYMAKTMLESSPISSRIGEY